MSEEKKTVELKDEELEKISGGSNQSSPESFMLEETKISGQVTYDLNDDTNIREFFQKGKTNLNSRKEYL